MSKRAIADIVHATSQDDQPFLYPWNRRLRSLNGISLRNLDVSPQKSRIRHQFNAHKDRSSTPTASAKRDADAVRRSLDQPRSSDDVSSHSERPSQATDDTLYTDTHQSALHGTTTGRGRLRRRSTLHWTGGNPLKRQQKLELLVEEHRPSTWFSLHSIGHESEAPLYISEVIERFMNPTFRFFNLTNTGPRISRLSKFIVRVWSRLETQNHYSLHVQHLVDLDSLHYMVRSLEDLYDVLPVNCILFHLQDGIYVSPNAIHSNQPQLLLSDLGTPRDQGAYTSTFDALMQLANLDDCIQDALSTKQQLENGINTILLKRRDFATRIEITRARLFEASNALTSEQRRSKLVRGRTKTLRTGLDSRKVELEKRATVSNSIKKLIEERQTDNAATKDLMDQSSPDAAGQLRRICEDLLFIFPIEALRNKSLQFTVREVYLPNSVFDDSNRDEIAAALGMVARLVQQLSSYLSVALPYPVKTTQGDVSIVDPVSIALQQRQYPLQPTNVAYKFEYGVFLLNKNIEFLMNKAGVRMLDIRHTLPNLKYLLYVLTAGHGEMPARKAGGVRGLLGGTGRFNTSRRSSQDSVLSQTSYSAKIAGDRNLNGRLKAPSPFGPGNEAFEADPFTSS